MKNIHQPYALRYETCPLSHVCFCGTENFGLSGFHHNDTKSRATKIITA